MIKTATAHPVGAPDVTPSFGLIASEVNVGPGEFQVARAAPAERIVFRGRGVEQPAAVGFEDFHPRGATVRDDNAEQHAIGRPLRVSKNPEAELR
jgi:hypothetical protein